MLIIIPCGNEVLPHTSLIPEMSSLRKMHRSRTAAPKQTKTLAAAETLGISLTHTDTNHKHGTYCIDDTCTMCMKTYIATRETAEALEVHLQG